MQRLFQLSGNSGKKPSQGQEKQRSSIFETIFPLAAAAQKYQHMAIEEQKSIWLQAQPIDQNFLTNQESEPSAGEIANSIRAEEIVNQILPTDESLEEETKSFQSQVIQNKMQASQLQNHKSSIGMQQKRSRIIEPPGQQHSFFYPEQQEQIDEQKQVLSPSRVIERSSNPHNMSDDVNSDEGITENPFQVAAEDCDTASSKESDALPHQDNRTISEPTRAVNQINVESEIAKEQQYAIEEADQEADQSQKNLGVSKQRSNSDSLAASQSEKTQTVKQRHLMMPILQLFNPVPIQTLTEGAALLKEKERAKVDGKSKESAKEESKSKAKQQKEPLTPQQPPLKKKESIFNKLFRKPDKPAPKQDQAKPKLEESNTTSQKEPLKQQSEQTQDPTKKTEKKKGELKSRFERFFGKKKQENKAGKDGSEKIAKETPEEETKTPTSNQDKQLGTPAEPAPHSSLDTGFSANLGDQIGEDILERADEGNVLAAEDEDKDDTGELSNEEIFRVDQVNFMPTPAPVNYQFSFNKKQAQNSESDKTASHLSEATVSDFTSEHSQDPSRPTTQAQAPFFGWQEAGHSQHATIGGSTHSVFSLEEQNNKASHGFRPRQRAHSQLNDISGSLSQTNNDDSEWQAVFPGAQVQNQPQQMFDYGHEQQQNSTFIQNQSQFGMNYTEVEGFRQIQMPIRNSAGFLGHRNNQDNLSLGGFYMANSHYADSEQHSPFVQQRFSQTDLDARLSLGERDSFRRSISQTEEAKPEIGRSFSNQYAHAPGGGAFLGLSSQGKMRISEPFTPTQGPSFSFFTRQQHQKPLSSLGAIQGQQSSNSDMISQRLRNFSDHNQHVQDFRQPVQLERPQIQATSHAHELNENQQTPWQTGAKSQRSTSGGVWSSGPQTGVSSGSRAERISNASNSQTSQPTTNKDTSDSASCSEFMKRNKKRKHRRTKKKTESRHAHDIAAGLQATPSEEQSSLQCYCCSTGAISCQLELKKEEFNHMSAIERMKNLIMADQQLTHFQPIDMRKIGGSSTNCARACIEGRIKDDIWHECCACCSQVRNTLLSEMQGIASELCRDQLCSKFIQVQLSRCPSTDPAIIDFFFREIIKDEEALQEQELQSQKNNPTGSSADLQQDQYSGNQEMSAKKQTSIYASSLMKNVFGNYVAQLIFERGTHERKQQFYAVMLKQVQQLASDQYGCRIIQKAIVWLPIEQKLEIISQFEPAKLMNMMFSEEGNYILQCIVLNLPTEHIAFMLPLIETKLLELCKDRRGCRVIQRVLEKFPRHELAPIIDKIIKAANELTPQQYGNYVIVHILQKGLESEKVKILDSIMDNIVQFSMYQLGSNVVENCLKTAPTEYLDAILERISAVPVATPEGSRDVSLVQLLENQFGNYVIQHAFELSGEERKRVLNDKIEQAATEGHVQKTNMYAKHVFTLLHQYYASECKICQQRLQRQHQPHSHSHSNSYSYSNSHSAEAASVKRDSTPFGQAHSSKKIIGSEARCDHLSIGGKKPGTEQQSCLSTGKSAEKESSRFSAGLATTKAAAASNASSKTPTKIGKTSETITQLKKDSKSTATVEEEQNKEFSDEDDESQRNEECADGSTQGKVKKNRRRNRRRGKKNKGDGTLFQEDILKRLSEQDREDYLQKMVENQAEIPMQAAQEQSLFVINSGSNSGAASQMK